MAKRVNFSDRSIEGYGERKRDYGLISEDRTQQCNLPTKVIQGTWPQENTYHLGSEVDDLFRSASRQIKEDRNGLRKAARARKY